MSQYLNFSDSFILHSISTQFSFIQLDIAIILFCAFVQLGITVILICAFMFNGIYLLYVVF